MKFTRVKALLLVGVLIFQPMLSLVSSAEMEHDHILHVLGQTGWLIDGKNGAALILGLNPSTLRARMRKSGILRQYK